MPILCTEINKALKLTLGHNNVYDTITIQNDQFFRLRVSYSGDPFEINGTMLYLLYSGNNYFFTGRDMQPIYFTSLEMPFGSFYKTQINPVYYSKLSSLWNLGLWGNQYDDKMLFMFAEPYFIQEFEDYKDKQSLQFYFKFTNDNNPFMKAQITPQTYFGGLQKIGGYMAIFGLLKIALYHYNKKRFEDGLRKKYLQLVRESSGRGTESINGVEQELREKDVIKELLSYEMFMQLIIDYQRKNHPSLYKRLESETNEEEEEKDGEHQNKMVFDDGFDSNGRYKNKRESSLNQTDLMNEQQKQQQ